MRPTWLAPLALFGACALALAACDAAPGEAISTTTTIRLGSPVVASAQPDPEAPDDPDAPEVPGPSSPGSPAPSTTSGSST